jgi:DNA-binding transcriptional ArsR family regulator
MAAKVLEVKEAAARKLLTEVKFPNAKKASAKRLGEMLGELPGKLEEDEEDPDLSKPSGALLDKVSDAVAKDRNIKVLGDSSDDDDDEDEKPAKKAAKKGGKKAAKKDDDDEDEEDEDDDDEDDKKKGKKGKKGKKSGGGTEAYKRMKEQGFKIDKVLKKKSGKCTVESIAESTDLTESRVQRHIDYLEKRKKVKVGKNGRISVLEDDSDEE